MEKQAKAKANAKNKAAMRLSITLPPDLVEHVDMATCEGAMYDSPSEYIRDLVRRDMERINKLERKEILKLLASTFSKDNTSSPWSPDEFDELRKLAYKKKKKKKK